MNVYQKINLFLTKTDSRIKNIAPHLWNGAVIVAILSLTIYIISILSYIQIGLNPIIDKLFIIILGAALSVVLYFLFRVIFAIIRKLNPYFVATVATVLLLAYFLPGRFFTIPFICFEIICGGMLGFVIYSGFKKPLSIIICILILGSNIYLFHFLSDDGFDTTIPVSDLYWNQETDSVHIPNPSVPGIYPVKTLFYASGNDKRRKEYMEEVSIKTSTVDTTPFIDQLSGLSNDMLKLFWGFDSKNYPINGRVWYPEGEGKFPLIVIAHGNHLMYDYSDPGYEYLGKHLASRGYIVVSVDENFLNGDWKSDYNHQELFTRGWIILKHLENWREWNRMVDNPFYRMVDMDNIALVGHSRGGPSVMLAAAINKLNKYYNNANYTFDFNFSIKGIVQIAPSELYIPPRKERSLKLENTDYLLLYGGHDQDLYTNIGNRFYNNILFTNDEYHFKSALYIYRANHGQFNTVWGRNDRFAADAWFINRKPIMDGDEQRKITEIYISAFVEASLKGNKEFLLLLKDYRLGQRFLPREYYYNQFEDSFFRTIANFEEDLDVNTASVKGCILKGENLQTWKENVLVFKDYQETSQNTVGVYLGWDRTETFNDGIPRYTIQFDNDFLWIVGQDSINNLYFTICNNSDSIDNLDFTIELIAKGQSFKKTFSSFYKLPPILKQELSKCNFLLPLGKDIIHERVLQYIELPFHKFYREDCVFKPEDIEQINFTFDQTVKGEIIIDRIGVN